MGNMIYYNVKKSICNVYNKVKDHSLEIGFGVVGSSLLISNASADWATNGSISSPNDVAPAMASFGGWVTSGSQSILTQWPYSLITVGIIFAVIIAVGLKLLMKIRHAGGAKH